MDPVNHQIRPTARPSGLPVRANWELTTEPVPEPADFTPRHRRGGVRAFPDVLPKLFTGENIGKLILAVP